MEQSLTDLDICFCFFVVVSNPLWSLSSLSEVRGGGGRGRRCGDGCRSQRERESRGTNRWWWWFSVFFFSYFFNYFIHFSLIIISKISKLKARLKLDLIFNNFKIKNKKSPQLNLREFSFYQFRILEKVQIFYLPNTP